jgi:hypothetical protein
LGKQWEISILDINHASCFASITTCMNYQYIIIPVFEFQGCYMAKSFCMVVNWSTYLLVLRSNSQFTVKCNLCSFSPRRWDPSHSSESFSLVFTQQELQVSIPRELSPCVSYSTSPPICKYCVLKQKLCLCYQINDKHHCSVVYLSMWYIMIMFEESHGWPNTYRGFRRNLKMRLLYY